MLPAVALKVEPLARMERLQNARSDFLMPPYLTLKCLVVDTLATPLQATAVDN
jgi:hypothetical protein